MNTIIKICFLTLAALIGFSSAVSIFGHEIGGRASPEHIMGAGSMSEMQMMGSNHYFSQMEAPGVDAATAEQYPVMREGPVSVMSSSQNPMLHGFHSSHLISPEKIEPYVNLFVPTHRCSAGFYCRAVMTAYYNKQAKTVTVSFGYTVFSTTTATATLPSNILAKIKETSDIEVFLYVSSLYAVMKNTVPEVCTLPPRSAFNAMRAATDAMSACTKISGYTCSQYSYVMTCSV